MSHTNRTQPVNSEDGKIHSVSEISRDIRFALEGRFKSVWVEGEVSNLRIPASGHFYFTLKDSQAQISCVFFRAAAERSQFTPQDGQKIQVFGDISVYEQRGQYQIVVQSAQSAGAGELQARFEALKRKLEVEGLFNPNIKKPIPSFPETIGIVTSGSGAAFQDILKVMRRRAPWVRLILASVKVQGEGADGEIARAIQWLSTNPSELPKLDTLIVARGGGSIEDLWSFNEEQVARAIHACPIPIISGVGHEIDFTIADFVADRREPTPSAAAEAAVPDGAALHQRLDYLQTRLSGIVDHQIDTRQRTIDAHKREMTAREPARKLENWAQTMDYLDERMENAVARRLQTFESAMERYEAVLKAWNPEKDLREASEAVARLQVAMDDIVSRRIDAKNEQLIRFKHVLEAIGPAKTLKRGFSMTLDDAGEPVFDATKLKSGQRIKTRLAKGEVSSVVE